MVGMMTGGWADKAAGLLKLVRGSPDIPAKMERLRQLKELLLHRDPSLLPDFVPLLAELRRDQPSPVRRLLAECIGEIGLKHVELLPKIVPALISLLEDEAPAVVRQTIISGTSLFINTLEKVAIQGLSQSELDDSMESSWKSMLSFKDAVFPLAFQPGSDGIRLLAIKFVEALILLYTPDPSGSTDPPRENGSGFNISWLRGGHPLLKVGELSTVASQSLGILLDQLRCPQEKSLSNSIVIVLINSLSAIARKRPAFYGRILPVLLRLDPEISVIKGVQVSGAFHALKNAFVAFLKCTHPGAAPWRARLVVALKDMNAGNLVDQASLTDVIESDDAIKKEKLPLWACSDADGDVGRKRIKLEEVDDLSQDDDVSNKRARSTTVADEEAEESVHAPTDKDNNNVPSRVLGMDALDGSIGPVQQLVAVFAELVTQGDKASGSLDILISTISSDLLAEVVMANMSHLPPTFPKTEVEEDFVLNMASHPGLSWKDNSFIPPSSFVSDILSLSNSLSLLNAQRPTHLDTTIQLEKEERTNTSGDAALPSTYDDAYRSSVSGTDIPSFPVNVPGTETNSVFSSRVNDAVPLEDKIPGLGSIDHVDDVQESLDVSHSIAEEHQGSLEQVISSDSVLFETASSGSMPTHISESVGTRIASADSSEVPSTSSTFLPSQFLLPKMAAPVIDVTDEQKDNLQRVALERIIESHKQMAIAGFSNIRFSLLACLGVEFPSELDPWGLLQKHISLDYLNHEGHELTLHVLYRLFRESEQDQDFFSSTAAVSDYEKFLLAVAESLRDIFPASDKSLSKLLTEVPYLPKPVLKLLETLCSHDSKEKHDKDFQSGDRVTQGLSATWSLILQRPSNRDTCLKIALQSAVHHLEEVRMKAIRLVANKLFPMSCIAQKIEDFAGEMLRSVVDDFPVGEGMGAEGSIAGSLKDTDLERDQTSMVSNGISSDSLPTLNAPSTSLSEAQRRMALYFALCTKKHSLLQQIFIIYKSMPQAAKEAVHRHIPILVRTTGASADLLSIISDPPAGSEALLMQVLHTLTDGTVPSQELIISVRQLYDTKLKDVEVLIPILSYLSKDEVLAVFPQLVGLPLDKFHGVLSRILQGPPHTGISLTPEEVLIAIHGIDPEKDSISLKKVMDACTACFEQRQVFTQQVLAKVLNQLVEQIPLPLLFMRTVIQAIGAFPALVDFVMEILARLVNKQIWKYPKLWVGFLKCAVQTKPQSFNVLLQLPAAQLENALNRNPVLRSPIIEHASQPNIRSTLPRATLAVLGLVSDSQTTAPPQAIKSSAADASNSVAESGTENTQESTAVK